MGYLLLAILASAAIALVFKATESRDGNRLVITAANYGIAAVASLVSLLIEGWPEAGAGWFASLANEWRSGISGGAVYSPQASAAWAVIVGCLAGGCFFAGFITYQFAIRHHGVSLSGAFSRLGVLLPLAVSLVAWRQLPSAYQAAGILLAVGAIAIVNRPKEGSFVEGLKPSLLLLFLLAGCSEFSHALFQRYAVPGVKSIFLLSTFSVAFAISAAGVLWQRERPTRHDVLSGFAVGIPNYCSSLFLVMALATVPSVVAYPAYGAGAVLVIAVGGWAIYREALSLVDGAALVLAVAGIALINIS